MSLLEANKHHPKVLGQKEAGQLKMVGKKIGPQTKALIIWVKRMLVYHNGEAHHRDSWEKYMEKANSATKADPFKKKEELKPG